MEVKPEDLKIELNSGRKIFLLDVRQPWEFEFVHLEKSVNIPLPEFRNRINEVPKGVEIVTVCHHGNRSMQVAVALHSLGYSVRSLKGGLDEWARETDKSMKRY